MKEVGNDMKDGWKDFKAGANKTMDKIDEDMKGN